MGSGRDAPIVVRLAVSGPVLLDNCLTAWRSYDHLSGRSDFWRHTPGATPVDLLNARLKAASEL